MERPDAEAAIRTLEQARQEIITRLGQVRVMRDDTDQQEEEAVRMARTLGLSWEAIAQGLGRFRSSVWTQYHKDIP